MHKVFVIVVGVTVVNEGWKDQIAMSIQHKLDGLMKAPEKDWELLEVPDGHQVRTIVEPIAEE